MKTYVFFNDAVTEYVDWPGDFNVPIGAYSFEPYAKVKWGTIVSVYRPLWRSVLEEDVPTLYRTMALLLG